MGDVQFVFFVVLPAFVVLMIVAHYQMGAPKRKFFEGLKLLKIGMTYFQVRDTLGVSAFNAIPIGEGIVSYRFCVDNVCVDIEFKDDKVVGLDPLWCQV